MATPMQRLHVMRRWPQLAGRAHPLRTALLPASNTRPLSDSGASGALPSACRSTRTAAPWSRSIGGGVGVRMYSIPAGGKTTYTFEEVKKLVEDPDSDILLIDVREPAELQSSGTMPGAVNIPISSAADSFHISDGEFEARFSFARPSKDTPLLTFCKAGVRSHAAAELARAAGWQDVAEYPGSWLDWEKNGGPVEK